MRSNTDGPTTTDATTGHRHRHGKAGDAGHPVPDPLGKDDVERPTGRGPEGQQHPDPITAPAHGWVNSTTPTAASPGHTRAPSRAEGDSDTERPKKLQRAGGAQRQPVKSGHEQQGDGCGDHTQQHAGTEAGAGERTGSWADDSKQQNAAHVSLSQPAPSAPMRAISPTEIATPS